jgi:hypothetical protein
MARKSFIKYLLPVEGIVCRWREQYAALRAAVADRKVGSVPVSDLFFKERDSYGM